MFKLQNTSVNIKHSLIPENVLSIEHLRILKKHYKNRVESHTKR